MTLDLSPLQPWHEAGWDWTVGSSKEFGFTARIVKPIDSSLKARGDRRKWHVHTGIGGTPEEALAHLIGKLATMKDPLLR